MLHRMIVWTGIAVLAAVLSLSANAAPKIGIWYGRSASLVPGSGGATPSDHDHLRHYSAQAGWEFRAGTPLNSLPISGLHAPQLVPAFSRWPMASIFRAPFRISAEI